MRTLAVLVFACAASCALYLGATYLQLGKLGFPLDDSWIHLTFARNLALRHELAFLPGHLSAGSTSPLWSFSLAIGFLWPFGPEVWTYVLGVGLLFATAYLSARAARRVLPETAWLPPPVAIFAVLEWHLNWSADS